MLLAIMACSSETASAASLLITFLVGALVGWLAASHQLRAARGRMHAELQATSQPTNQTSPAATSRDMPETELLARQTSPAATTEAMPEPEGDEAAGMRRRQSIDQALRRRWRINDQPQRPGCWHAYLQRTATNDHTWSVHCPDCQLRMSVWFHSQRDHDLTKESQVEISKELLLGGS